MEKHFKIEIDPVAQGRPRLTTRGGYPHAYDPQKSRIYKQVLRAEIQSEMVDDEPFDKPLNILMIFSIKAPKYVMDKAKKEGEITDVPGKRPDLDNYVKSTLDALNGVLWTDDSLIVGMTAMKRYDTVPSVEIYVGELGQENGGNTDD